MNVYMIYSPSSSFGQTNAGCHWSAGQEEVVAFAGLASTDAEISAFFKVADLKLCFKLGDQTTKGEQWVEMFPSVDMPIPHTRAGLKEALKVGSKRCPNDPWIQTGNWGRHYIVFSETPPELQGPSVSMDRENLAYQRDLLS